MFDSHFYTTLLNAAHSVLRNNLSKVGEQFAQEFIQMYDPRNGQRSEQYAKRFYDYVASTAQRLNGVNRVQNDDQLFGIVASYVEGVFGQYVENSRRQSFGGNSFMQSSGGGFMNSGGGFTVPRMGGGSFLGDDVVGGNQPTNKPQEQQQQKSIVIPQLQVVSAADNIEYSHNPLDDVALDELEFKTVDEPINWGMNPSKDDSIVLTDKKALKSRDERIIIHVCEGFARTYLDDPMDVAKDFFRIVPDQFLADLFVLRVFYNHVEEIDIATDEFIKVRDEFISKISEPNGGLPGKNANDKPIYPILIDILNHMKYGPRKALVDYLVAHINRALHLSCGMEEQPSLRIKFTEIEDLEELLGTSFDHKFLEIPNGKEKIKSIVSAAIVNALSLHSDAMFVTPSDKTVDVIKTSPVFPYSIPGVYPNKDVIPPADTEEAGTFWDLLTMFRLSNKTFIRSLRSVVFTNVLGGKILSKIGDNPAAIQGQIPALLGKYALVHSVHDMRLNQPYYDKVDRDVGTYQQYLADKAKFEADDINYLIDNNNTKAGIFPVDQTLFALQYKKSPKDYLMAFDVFRTMDGHDHSRGRGIFAKKKIDVLKTTV